MSFILLQWLSTIQSRGFMALVINLVRYTAVVQEPLDTREIASLTVVANQLDKQVVG